MNTKYKAYDIDLDELSKSRECGVSGLLRVKDDAEFLEECIESCIPALDELVIVYGETNEESMRIIEAAACKYRDKIKVYRYEPKLYIGNLSADNIKELMSDKSMIKHTLANYCNYALIKTRKSFVVKIDADQVYFTSELKELCDCYRTPIFEYGFKHRIVYWTTVIYFKVASRLHLSFPLMNKKVWWLRYKEALYNRIRKYKCSCSLSGINVVYQNGEAIIPLGECTDTSQNILPPYNGVGDTLIFRVSRQTYFEPYTDINYEQQNKAIGCLIERLVGVNMAMFAGVFWIHLNSHRRVYAEVLEHNIRKYTDRYLPIDDFVKCKFLRVIKNTNKLLCSFRYRLSFAMIHNSMSKQLVDKVKSYSIGSDGYIKKHV